MIPPPAVGCRRQPMQLSRAFHRLGDASDNQPWSCCIVPPKAGHQQGVG